jgi:transposase-like protein
MQWDASVIAISVPRPNYPCKFKAQAVTSGLTAGGTVVKLRRRPSRISQSTDLWIVLASCTGDVSPDAGVQPPFTAR